MKTPVALVVLSLATPAWAEFTDLEKVEARKLRQAFNDSQTALWYWGAAAQYTPTGGSTFRSRMTNSLKAITNAYYWHTRGTALLFYIPPDDSGEWTPTTRTRGEFVAEAIEAFTNAHNAYGIVAAQLTSARSGAPGSAVIQIDRAIVAANSAAAGVASFNKGLGYDHPRPLDYPQIIGPHGDYNRSETNVIRALAAIYNLLGTTTSYYGQASVPKFTWAFRLALRVSDNNKMAMTAFYRWALIPVEPIDCKLNRFHLVAFSMLQPTKATSESGDNPSLPSLGTQPITGMPYGYHSLLGELLPAFHDGRAQGTTQIAWANDILKRWSDMWRFMNGAVESMLRFPDASKLDGVGDTGSPNSPFASPVCPVK